MRKLLFILAAFTACLLFAERDGAVRVRQAAPTAAFSAGEMHADQWRCERSYNSDLNQPRVLRVAEAEQSVPSFRHSGPDRAERPVLRCAASCGGTGVAKLTAEFQSSDLSAGLHAVDYYVYRLRRLII